ncbi:MAG TPA: glycosyltransferase family 4 protein [Patescibacteria group bacterium]|nr:glycosyltransferase family 4 protein [Patescibacteria group bacterium]
MRIAQIAPLGERVPPKKYGGTERIVYSLTEELVNRGHDVTLFASGDSETSAHLVSVYPKSLREANISNPYEAGHLPMLNIGTAYSMQNKFDIIHDHNDSLSFPTAMLATTPVVMTLHGAFGPSAKKMYEGLNKFSSNVNLVSISMSQRRPSPDLNYIGNVYHGINVKDYIFSDKNEGYLLFVGRINEEKGVHHAIEVAEFLDLPLIIAAKLDENDRSYFAQYVKPRLNERIKWIGEVSSPVRNRLMSRALCLLHPVTWREPFGLVLIEAMACGAPVVAFNRGSIPEIVKHGKTGFIAEDTSEMIEYIKRVSSIKRANCRLHVKNNFSVEKMVGGYESIYEEVISLRRESVSNKIIHQTLTNN